MKKLFKRLIYSILLLFVLGIALLSFLLNSTMGLNTSLYIASKMGEVIFLFPQYKSVCSAVIYLFASV